MNQHKYKDQFDDPERALIQKALQSLEDRMVRYGALVREEPSEFLKRRLEEMAEDLVMAHKTIASLSRRLERYESDPPPAELWHALRRVGTQHQPVRLRVGGRLCTVMVPPLGPNDEAGAIDFWRGLQRQIGEGKREDRR